MQQIGLDATLNNVPDFTAGINTMNKAVDGFAKNSTDAGKNFGGGFGEIVTGALRKIGELSVEALLKAGQAVAGFVKDSIGLAGDFEAGMLTFQSVAGKDVDASGLEEFRDLFLDIGKRLPVSTSEVQQAATEMVKGGIDPATIAAGGLEQNIQFAAAAMGGDLVKAAEISSKIMGGWAGVGATAAEKADFLTHATDLLTKAANASATDVEGLSLGIFNAQGIARTAGVGFEDLTTTLAALAPRFESSSVAGNSLKNMIARLQPTTDPATAAMAGLGLYTQETGSAFYDAQGNFVGFEQAAQLLQGSLQGLTKEQQAAALQQIFGNDAMGAAAGLAELGAAGYQEMADALANANGVAEAAALKQQGFNTALDNAKGSVEALQITIGSALLPILTDLLNNVVAPAINAFTDWADAIFSAEDPMAALVDQINIFSPILGTIVSAIVDFITSGGDLGVVADDLNEGMAGLGDAFLAVVDAATTVADAIQDVVSWFSKGSDASDDLGGAVDDLSSIWTRAKDTISNVADGYRDIIDSVLPQIQQFIHDHGEEIKTTFQSAWDKINDIIELALDLYNEIVPPILHTIADFIDDHGSEIQRILKAAWDMVSTIISGALDLIKETLKLAIDVIHGDWDAVWKDLEAITTTLTDTIKGVVKGFLDIIAGFFDTSVDEIVDLWQNNWDQLVEIATQTDWAQVGRDVVDGIISGLASAWGSLVSWIEDKISGLVDSALATIGADSPAKEWMPVGAFSVQGIMQGFSDMWPGLTALVSGLGDDLITQAADIATNVQSAIADAFGATASIDRQIAANLDKFKDVLPQYEQYTKGALRQAQKDAEAFLDPAEGAKFFKLRSSQILEYAKLQTELSEAASQQDKDRISQQMLLINQAQTAEISAFNANAAAKSSPMDDLVTQMQSLFKSLPGALESDVMNQLFGLLNQLQSPVTNPYANPVSSTTSNYRTTNLNMPIYTNQSPGAIQDSMAIAGAALL